MAYFSQHVSRIGRKYNIPLASMEPGIIVEMRYTKLPDPKRNGLRETKTYLMLVMHPGGGAVSHTHCVTLESISTVMIDKLVKKYGVVNSKFLQNVRRINLPHLNIENPKKFYINESNTQLFEGTYRTLIPSSINSIKIINYNFTAV